MSVKCASLVALTIGEVTPGCTISQARATRPGVEWCCLATYCAAARLATGIILTAILAGKETGRKRIVGNHPDCMFLHHRQQLRLKLLTGHQVVMRLQANVAYQSIGFAYGHCFLQASRTVVRSADVPHLACPDQLVEGRHGFFKGCVFVIDM